MEAWSPAAAGYGMNARVVPVTGNCARNLSPVVLGGARLGQTFDQMLGLPPYAGDLMRIAGHGAMSWLGFYVGVKESGFISTVGWTLGIAGGVIALMDLASLINGSE